MFKIDFKQLLKRKLAFSKFFLGLIVFLGLVLMFQTGRFFWENRDVSSQNVTVYVQDSYIPGGVGNAQIVLKALNRDKEIKDGHLEINIKELQKDSEEEKLIEQIYDKEFVGDTAVANFDIPKLESGKYLLEFIIKTKQGRDEIKKEINISTASKIVISTDRPLYKPGQELQYRTLLLDKTTLKPMAGEDVVMTIVNPKGDKIFRKEFKMVSDYL